MREGWRTVGAALSLGAIGYVGSEAMFWVFAPDGIGLADWALTVLAYGLAAACALSAVAWSGLGGWRAAFLGGALVGFIVEGAVVGTMYDAFPVQLVWTPLAWHALITGLGVFGLHQAVAGGVLWRQVAAMVVLGAGVGYFGSYWPVERAVLPEPEVIFLYLVGTGVAAVLGFVVLDRIGEVPRLPVRGLLVAPVLVLCLWLFQGVLDPRPVRLVWPVMIGLTVWMMRRLGHGGPVRFGPAAPVGRQALFLIAPLVAASIAAFVVRGSAGSSANVVVALVSGLIGLGLWIWLGWRALRG